MALCVCKCLNVSLESEKVDSTVYIEKLELTSLEQRDLFFDEKLLSCSTSSLKCQMVQPALTAHRVVDRWTLNSCLSCGQSTHAVLNDIQGLVLIPKALLTTPEQVNNMRKSKNYSPVFNLLVPEVSKDVAMKENVDTSNVITNEKKIWPAQQALGTLSKQLNQTLQTQLEAVEDNVRQFRDLKYAEFEAYREKAHRDHKILSSIVSKTRSRLDAESCRVDASLDNGPPSPQLPPLQRRRLSSIKDAKKITQFVKHTKNLPPEEDSLDAEDIFDLEGTDWRQDMISDQDDYDSDNLECDAEVSDEGIHIGGSGRREADMARSLPISVPKFPTNRSNAQDIYDEEEPQDIAASIKALARSVHGDVFELPRPRFSTQI